MCEEELSRLEDSLSRVVDRLESLQAENEELKRRNQKLTENLEEMEGEKRKDFEQIGRLKDQRSRIRSRLLRVKKNLDVLDNLQE